MREHSLSLAEVSEALRAPFSSGQEQFRPGPSWSKGEERWTRPLIYISARSVFERLDDVVGPDGWQTDLERLGPGIVLCRLTVLGIAKTDIGMAGPSESEPDKAAASDAIKRAAIQFGVGRYLYAVELPSTKLERRGNDWVLPKGWRPPGRSLKPADNTLSFPAPASGIITAKQAERIADELRRVGWNEQEGRTYLLKTYQKRSRSELTGTEASEFIAYLVSLPAKAL